MAEPACPDQGHRIGAVDSAASAWELALRSRPTPRGTPSAPNRGNTPPSKVRGGNHLTPDGCTGFAVSLSGIPSQSSGNGHAPTTPPGRTVLTQ